MLRFAVLGAGGRMGRAVINAALALGDMQLVAAIERSESPLLGADAGVQAGLAPVGVAIAALGEELWRSKPDVVIEFAGAEALGEFLRRAKPAPLPLISGSTGLGSDIEASLNDYSRLAPLVASANFSSGVTLLLELARIAALGMGANVEAEIVEIHHHHKKDSPSGTAKLLAASVEAALGRRVDERRCGRDGIIGARPARELGIHAVRGGEVVGEHTLYLFGKGERLELSHKAQSRDCLAQGAVRAARWLVNSGRATGRYDMRDVLNLGDLG